MTATDPQLAALLAERLEPAAEAYVEDMSTGPPPEDDRARVPPSSPRTPAGRSGASCSLAVAAREALDRRWRAVRGD